MKMLRLANGDATQLEKNSWKNKVNDIFQMKSEIFCFSSNSTKFYFISRNITTFQRAMWSQSWYKLLNHRHL